MQKKYLVAYNGSVAAKAALELAKHQAQLRGSHIDVVTSMEGGPKEKPEVISEANFIWKRPEGPRGGRDFP